MPHRSHRAAGLLRDAGLELRPLPALPGHIHGSAQALQPRFSAQAAAADPQACAPFAREYREAAPARPLRLHHTTDMPKRAAAKASQPLAETKPICGAASFSRSTASWYTCACGLYTRAASAERIPESHGMRPASATASSISCVPFERIQQGSPRRCSSLSAGAASANTSRVRKRSISVAISPGSCSPTACSANSSASRVTCSKSACSPGCCAARCTAAAWRARSRQAALPSRRVRPCRARRLRRPGGCRRHRVLHARGTGSRRLLATEVMLRLCEVPAVPGAGPNGTRCLAGTCYIGCLWEAANGGAHPRSHAGDIAMMSYVPRITGEVAYLLLIFALFVVPRAVQRLLIPAPSQVSRSAWSRRSSCRPSATMQP